MTLQITLLRAAAAAFGALIVFGSVAEAAEPRRINVKVRDGAPLVERVVLPVDKSIVIELDRDARDVLVSNPEMVDAVVRTPRRIVIVAMKVGQTNAFFFDNRGRQLLNLDIRVERDLTGLQEGYAAAMPEARIRADSVNDNVVLSGNVSSAIEADRARDLAARYVGDPKRVQSNLNVDAREQVMLRVRVAEMSRTISKQLGVDIDALTSAGSVPLRFSTANPFSLLGQALSNDSSFKIGDVAKNNVEGIIKALERAGVVRTLAEPNLTAISGESAKFLAGGEFPVPVARDRDGNVTIEFKPFGVGLGFTPVVLSDGRISVRISTEVSELTNEGAFFSQGQTFTDANGNVVTIPGVTIPALRVRRAETTVELPSGGSLVIAGLLQDTYKQNIDGVPGLKNVPVLGSLLQSRDFQQGETELVIMITPVLVDHVAPQEIAMPTDGFAPPSDVDSIFLGRLNALYGTGRRPDAGQKLAAPVGFVVR